MLIAYGSSSAGSWQQTVINLDGGAPATGLVRFFC
jgi:hypothetical protein